MMEIKFTVQGLLIYLTMVVYFVGFVFMMGRRVRYGWMVYGVGFVIAVMSVGFRWWSVGHVPLGNLFEVFLGMAALMFPLSVFCWCVLGVRRQGQWDMLLGVIILFPAGFVLPGGRGVLPPALQSFLFVPHVLAYVAGYVVMTKATIQAVSLMGRRGLSDVAIYEENAYRMTVMGFVLLSIGLMAGAWWGKLAWGDWWNWDQKEMWSLATWLLYVSYFHFRVINGRRFARVNAGFIIVGMVCIVITLLFVSLATTFAGKHSYGL